MLVVSLLLAGLAAQAVAPDRAVLRLEQQVRDKNFYALTILAESPEIRRIEITKDPTAKWTDEQRQTIESRLRALYRESPAVRQLVDGRLRRSGVMQVFAARPGEDLIAAAWQESAAGMNRLIDVYSAGVSPRYAAIDSPTQDLKSPAFGRLKDLATLVVKEEAATGEAFFAPSLRYALLLLEINLRDEAGRYEPMESGVNRAAFERIRKVRWSDYPYTAIVIPGSGSDRPGVPLSPMGRLRLHVGAARYHAKKAPFLIVSGGHVHPSMTPFNEALEMKKLLMSNFGVPEHAILVDPHARHTTTNLRNAARLIYRYGIPFDRPALITTDPGQSSSIEDPRFTKRCSDELRYLPWRSLKRVNPFDLEFVAAVESLFIDPTDPLDP